MHSFQTHGALSLPSAHHVIPSHCRSVTWSTSWGPPSLAPPSLPPPPPLLPPLPPVPPPPSSPPLTRTPPLTPSPTSSSSASCAPLPLPPQQRRQQIECCWARGGGGGWPACSHTCRSLWSPSRRGKGGREEVRVEGEREWDSSLHSPSVLKGRMLAPLSRVKVEARCVTCCTAMGFWATILACVALALTLSACSLSGWPSPRVSSRSCAGGFWRRPFGACRGGGEGERWGRRGVP